MIFVTTGHQMPFDRLMAAADELAARNPELRFLAQIGDSRIRPKHMESTQFLAPDAFQAALKDARAVISHAGTGTILTALEYGKPLLVMPRRAELRETRSDHQIETAKWFAAEGLVLAAKDQVELPEKFAQLLEFAPSRRLGDTASGQLTDYLATYARGVLGPRNRL
jgi:exopolysaccharide biosynthesis glucuronosyltransferase PssE